MKQLPRVRGPRVVNTLRVLRDPFATYRRWQERLGDTYVVPAINGDVVVSADPNVVRDLFRATTEQVEPFAVGAAAPLIGPGSLLMLKGAAHGRERKLLMPPFHGPRMRAYGDIIVDIAQRKVGTLAPGVTLSAAEAMLAISLDVIVQAVFGVREPERVRQWGRAVSRVVGAFHPALIFAPFLQHRWVPFWRRFTHARDELDQLFYDEIRQRRSAPTHGDDILSLMLEAHYEDGSAMDDSAVRDELMTLLVAGHETTQISMAWALYRLCHTPEAHERLIVELDATDGSPEALAKAPYLDAVVQEALRLDPVVPDLVRTLTVDLELGGWPLKAGMHVSPVAALLHQRAASFGEPQRFRPERFIDDKPKPWEFVPFGGGVRRCIGAALATYEMKLVLGTWLRAVELRSVRPDVPVRRNVTMGSRHGVMVQVVRRRGPSAPRQVA